MAEPEAGAPGERSRCCTLAVVALGVPLSAGAPGLAYIHSLKRQGFRVICYEDGAQSWPLSLRCQVLLAGSSWLLDSTKAEFTQELRRLLAGLLQANTGRRDEEERVKRVMKQLGSVGESQAILAVFHTVLRISQLSDLPVLITGETGTGKELLAHAIHQLDLKRRYEPFVALNCSAISPGLAESELFGHRRGAFTGADRDRKGLIRSAEGGVLFLDEVGELDDALQAKLLRVLQEPRVLAVGEEREIAVNVRIVAATNRDLAAMVQRGQFRADLFHRLHILPIHIPPLRERPMDLRPLVEHFLEKHQLLKPAWTPTVAADFLDALMQLELPGNARQLENLVRWVLVNKDDDAPLSLSDLPHEVWQQLSEPGKGLCPQPQAGDDRIDVQQSTSETLQQDMPVDFADLLAINDWNLSRSLQFCEKLLLETALHKAHGNQSQTARLLGITPRSVYNKLHKHQLHQ
ncbi:MAG TPA: sigma-54 dependent transcriptional regulator [Candidatus Tectomicrobia bacterium]|nr:sigma-54 dependent transcriptional regulator [Candidatus Tectomicrobia bacterium]